VRHGAAWLHEAESDPCVETESDASDGGGAAAHAAVGAATVALCERFPAASTASTANVYVVPHARPVAVNDVVAVAAAGAVPT
jgi:hypothetical protein